MIIKKIFSFRQKYYFLFLFQSFKPFSYFKKTKINAKKRYAYIFLAADYGNLGDVAITYAQTRFLKEHLGSDFEVIEIPISHSLEGLHFVKKNIQSGDLVTSVGGGNLGDLYDQIEFIRQLAVQFFPKNKFISFPQTFDFNDSSSGKKALELAKNTYNNHPDLYFVAREKTSYDLMRTHFTNATVLFTPDIVISLDQEHPERERKGAVICMRQDQEKNLSEKQTAFIQDEIKNRFESVSYYDTHINKNSLSTQERENELQKIWDAFKSAELVITDRLHGMIFCYITNTPCLVFQNNNHKVRETYDWIKGNSNINLVPEFSENAIKEFFTQSGFNTGTLIDLKKAYEPLIHILK